MTLKDKLIILQDKINRLENSSKDVKCPGVLQKLRRQRRNLEKLIAEEA